MSRVCQFRVWERMAQHPGMSELTAMRAEQSRLEIERRYASGRKQRERVYAKW